MDLFISADGDGVGSRVGLARLHDDVEGTRRISNAIDAGNQLWIRWAQAKGGQVVSAGGDEIAVQVPVSALSEVEKIREDYANAAGATASVGIGKTLSESTKALFIAKLTGKDKTVLWQPNMQAEIDAATAKPETEQDKLRDEYLGKADHSVSAHTSHNVGKNSGAHAGFVSHHKVNPSLDDADAKSAKDEIKQSHTASAQAAAHAPKATPHTFEDHFHMAAQGQEQQDAHAHAAHDSSQNDVKTQLVQVLMQVKQQLPVITQLQQTAPETYQAIMGLVQGVVLLGRKLTTPADEAVAGISDGPPQQPPEQS